MARLPKPKPQAAVIGPALLEAVEAVTAAFEHVAGLEEQYESLRVRVYPDGKHLDTEAHSACRRFERDVYDPAFAEMERVQDGLVEAMAAAGVSAVVYKGRIIVPTMGTLCRDWHEFPTQILFIDPAKVVHIAEGGERR
jgi:hypothetical protein